MDIPSHPFDPPTTLDGSTVIATSPADTTSEALEPVNAPIDDAELRALDVTAGEPD